jgi:flagellar biosynthesis protein FlgN
LEHTLTETVFDPVRFIRSECDAIRNFIDTLRREQGALRQADVSLLPLLAEEKAQRAQHLAQLADARKCLLLTQGRATDRAGVERWLQGFPVAADAWQELIRLAETASQLNSINGKLVGQRLRYNQQAIAALQDATQVASLYGANGHTQPFLVGRQLGEV